MLIFHAVGHQRNRRGAMIIRTTQSLHRQPPAGRGSAFVIGFIKGSAAVEFRLE
jgi:hypothetical protein